MRRLLTLLTLTLLMVQFTFAQNGEARSAEAGKAYNDGLNFAKKQKYDAAVKEFKKAIAADDNFPGANYMLGYCYKKLNNMSNAEKYYKATIDLDSKFEKAYVALGNLYAQADRKSEAINTYTAVLAINANNPKANFGLGKVHFDKKEYTKAIPYLQKAVEVHKKYVLAYTVLALSYQNVSRYDDAVAAFETAISFEKKRNKKGKLYYQLGETCVQAKKLKKAEDALLNAVKMSTNSTIKAGSNFYLGEVYKMTGRKTKALLHYGKAAKNRRWKASADYQIDLLKNPDKYVD